MRFVPLKSAEQQSALMLLCSHDLLVRQRTMRVNAVRGHFAEFGIVAPQGIRRVGELAGLLIEEDATTLPSLARQALRALLALLQGPGEADRELGSLAVFHRVTSGGSQGRRRSSTLRCPAVHS
jgi:transposase